MKSSTSKRDNSGRQLNPQNTSKVSKQCIIQLLKHEEESRKKKKHHPRQKSARKQFGSQEFTNSRIGHQNKIGFESQCKGSKFMYKKKEGKNRVVSSRLPKLLESQSNSLIVFSEKEETLNSTTRHRHDVEAMKTVDKYHRLVFSPTQAAIIIQKTWRGYLTRRLLEQYINDEEPRLLQALTDYQSRNSQQGSSYCSDLKKEYSGIDSARGNNNMSRISYGEPMYFKEPRQFLILPEEVPNSSLGLKSPTINYVNTLQTEILNHQETTLSPNQPLQFPCQTNHTKYGNYTIDSSRIKEQENDDDTIEESRICMLAECSSSRLKQSRLSKHKRDNSINNFNNRITIQSNIYNYSCCANTSNKPQQIVQPIDTNIQAYLPEQSASAEVEIRINQLQKIMEGEARKIRGYAKEQLAQGGIEFDQMVTINSNIKDVEGNGIAFLNNVSEELNAMLNAMQLAVRTVTQYEPKSEYFVVELPTENDEVHLHTFSQGQVKIQKYIAELMNEHHECHDEMSELEFLCEILKVNTEKGLKDIIERCLMQFTIEIITEGIGLEELSKRLSEVDFEDKKTEDISGSSKLLYKWVTELNKWEMGTIHEVTQAMESSSFIATDTIN